LDALHLLGAPWIRSMGRVSTRFEIATGSSDTSNASAHFVIPILLGDEFAPHGLVVSSI